MPGLPAETKPAENSFALVTGASSGIGACFARALAARGLNLVLVARSKDKLESLRTEIVSQYQVRVEVVQQDLGVEGAAHRLVATLGERNIVIDLLVNNAGFGAHGEFWKLSLERQAEMLRLNIATLTDLTYLLIPAMVERRRGGVINTSSTAGFQPVPYLSVYAATKAYVTSFSMGLAEEVRPFGVKVLAVCPGGTDTNFFAAGQFNKTNFRGGLQSPEAVVEVALRSYDHGASLVVTRWINRLMILGERFVSLRFAAEQAGKLFRPGRLDSGK
jgi:uncharacterized protein